MHSRIRQSTPRRRGFTLAEVVVVLGVILLLAGIAIPMVEGYIEDAQRTRAKSETKMLGAAVMNFYKDVGVYPARNTSGQDNRLRVLGTGPSVPASNPFTNGSSWSSWFLNASFGDTFDNHLLRNTPQGSSGAAYSTTGEARWRGPYLADTAPLDPWGRPYMVMVMSFWSSHATNFKKAIILSAGPNGQIETPANCSDTAEISGDDVGLVLARRL